MLAWGALEDPVTPSVSETLFLCLLVPWSHNSRPLFWTGTSPLSCSSLTLGAPTTARWWPAGPAYLSGLLSSGCWSGFPNRGTPPVMTGGARPRSRPFALEGWPFLSSMRWSGLVRPNPGEEAAQSKPVRILLFPRNDFGLSSNAWGTVL